jgi:putative glutamine amidotransferase
MSSSRPFIGVPCYKDTSSSYSKSPVNAQYDAYLEAVVQGGGTPFLIPLNVDKAALRQLYDAADGILLAGGGDINPTFYNQSPQAKLYSVQPDRDQIEITLSQWAADEGKPALAICRGIQIMAVAAGGTLCQDLPTQKPEAELHSYVYQTDGTNPEDYLAHEVELAVSSRLAKMLDTNKIWTNSLHHQAIETLPKPLEIVGCSTDGVVEAIEMPHHPFFCGVQWHPELLMDRQESQQIFRAFVQARH